MYIGHWTVIEVYTRSHSHIFGAHTHTRGDKLSKRPVYEHRKLSPNEGPNVSWKNDERDQSLCISISHRDMCHNVCGVYVCVCVCVWVCVCSVHIHTQRGVWEKGRGRQLSRSNMPLCINWRELLARFSGHAPRIKLSYSLIHVSSVYCLRIYIEREIAWLYFSPNKLKSFKLHFPHSTKYCKS